MNATRRKASVRHCWRDIVLGATFGPIGWTFSFARSYARGDWVDAPLSANQYKSDYDILVIVSQEELTDRAAHWAKAEERLVRAYTIEKTLQTPVNFIIHSLHEVNDGLAHGRVFFIEVKQDGIALYEADDSELATPSRRRRNKRWTQQKGYFEEHVASAAEQLDRSSLIGLLPW